MINKLFENLPKDIDALLITSDVNRIYLSGFDASDDMLFITRDEAYFLADSRYIEEVKNKVKHMTPLLVKNFYDTLRKLIEKHNVKRIGFEDRDLTVFRFERLKKELKVEFVPIGDLILNLRKIKSEEEIKYIKKAQTIADKTFEHLLKYIRPGRTEREVMLELKFYSMKLGSEGDSFEPIVISGKNTSLPHGLPTDKVIEEGDFVTLDFGCVVNHYRSDMTRTIAVGFVTDEMKRIYNIVLDAQKNALDNIKAGMTGKECDSLARDIINKAGFGDCFGHGLGHSVGLEIHEAPRFSPNESEIMKENMIMTVEPGIYLEGNFGVRIEDMVVIEKEGICNLTASPKELIVLN